MLTIDDSVHQAHAQMLASAQLPSDAPYQFRPVRTRRAPAVLRYNTVHLGVTKNSSPVRNMFANSSGGTSSTTVSVLSVHCETSTLQPLPVHSRKRSSTVLQVGGGPRVISMQPLGVKCEIGDNERSERECLIH